MSRLWIKFRILRKSIAFSPVVFDSNGEDNLLTTLERNRIESTPEDTIKGFDFITIRVRFITRDSIIVIAALYLYLHGSWRP